MNVRNLVSIVGLPVLMACGTSSSSFDGAPDTPSGNDGGSDVGGLDSSPSDTGHVADTAPGDTTAPDVGTHDSGTTDTAPVDTGSPDASTCPALCTVSSDCDSCGAGSWCCNGGDCVESDGVCISPPTDSGTPDACARTCSDTACASGQHCCPSISITGCIICIDGTGGACPG